MSGIGALRRQVAELAEQVRRNAGTGRKVFARAADYYRPNLRKVDCEALAAKVRAKHLDLYPDDSNAEVVVFVRTFVTPPRAQPGRPGARPALPAFDPPASDPPAAPRVADSEPDYREPDYHSGPLGSAGSWMAE